MNCVAGRGWAILGLLLSAFGGRTTTAIPGGQAGYGDGYTWLKMGAKYGLRIGCAILVDFPVVDKGRSMVTLQMRGLTAGGMGIA